MERTRRRNIFLVAARSAFFFSLFLLLSLPGNAQQPQFSNDGIDPTQPKGISVEEIIRKFTAKEKEFADARNNYTYQRSVKIWTYDNDGDQDGERQEVVDITYDDKGKLRENVVFAPQPAEPPPDEKTHLQFTSEDFDDIRNRYPFVLTSSEAMNYQILYIGKQRLDEIDTYVFELAPKNLKKGERFFEGRIWVDQQDLQIVKTQGKPAYLVPEDWIKHPEKAQQFPSFTTYREQIDGKYWFPTYVKCDEVLHFPGNMKKKMMPADLRVKIVVKYTDYKHFASRSKITVIGEETDKKDDKKPTPPPVKK